MKLRYPTLKESEEARKRRYNVIVNGQTYSSTKVAFEKLNIPCQPNAHIAFRSSSVAGNCEKVGDKATGEYGGYKFTFIRVK